MKYQILAINHDNLDSFHIHWLQIIVVFIHIYQIYQVHQSI